MERITSLELVTSAWKAEVFPIKLYPHYGASKGGRTLTMNYPGILSPVRLPIPPYSRGTPRGT